MCFGKLLTLKGIKEISSLDSRGGPHGGSRRRIPGCWAQDRGPQIIQLQALVLDTCCAGKGRQHPLLRKDECCELSIHIVQAVKTAACKPLKLQDPCLLPCDGVNRFSDLREGRRLSFMPFLLFCKGTKTAHQAMCAVSGHRKMPDSFRTALSCWPMSHCPPQPRQPTLKAQAGNWLSMPITSSFEDVAVTAMPLDLDETSYA